MSTNSIILVKFIFVLITGLEPVLLKESNFKSDVSTNSTKRAYFLIPQFDILTLGAQIFGLLTLFFAYYFYNISIAIPYFAEVKKARIKVVSKETKESNLILANLKNKNLVKAFVNKNFL